jgi:endonuclease YncB( thermonuclease family)
MSTLRIGTTTWILRPAPLMPLQPARPSPFAIWGRTLVLIAATVGFGFTTVASAPPRADQGMTAGLAQNGTPKDATRLSEPKPRPRSAEKTVTMDPTSTVSLFEARPLAAGARFAATADAPSPDAFVAGERTADHWHEEEFAEVAVVDGRTLQAGAVHIRLVGLDLPMPEQVCRTLDGRLEPCARRAATQLELLTRWRPVTCHYRMENAGEAIGRCRIGLSDLSERMIKTGYAWQSAEAPKRSTL